MYITSQSCVLEVGLDVALVGWFEFGAVDGDVVVLFADIALQLELLVVVGVHLGLHQLKRFLKQVNLQKERLPVPLDIVQLVN